MFAYIRYEDKHKAVLPTTLIKRFTPADVDDFNHEKSKMVYWEDEHGSQAGYYKAKVVMLGGKLMLTRNSSRRALTGCRNQQRTFFLKMPCTDVTRYCKRAPLARAANLKQR